MPGRYRLRFNGTNSPGSAFQEVSVSVTDARSLFDNLSFS